MSDQVRIIDVGPRDGLQNEKLPIPTDVKLRFIQALADAGLNEIEATSFVSPKWVPQLGDAAELWPHLPSSPLFSALVPNAKGLERAIVVGVKRIAVFTAASDAFTRKNINMSVEESLEAFRAVIEEFRAQVPGGWVRGYVSTAFECPFAGLVAPSAVREVSMKLLEMGVDDISIGDTIGVAGPSEVHSLTNTLLEVIPIEKFAYHFHDTHGTAVANVSKALELGIRAFDSSAGGLGGCPYAPGATGNLATEDLVYLLNREGFRHGVALDRLATASLEILKLFGRSPYSKGQLAQLSASGTFPT